MIAYCVFCETVKRNELADRIGQRFGIKALAPRIIQRKWVKGRAEQVIHDYLPGYIFLYADAPCEDIAGIARMDKVYRILGDRDAGYRLSGRDLAFAEMILNCDGTIGVMKTYREGDRVKLAEGALGRVEGEIIKLDRRGRALIRYAFDNVEYKTWVAYEMIDGGMPEIPGGAG